jgi:Flp pilus assembly pilin Flp
VLPLTVLAARRKDDMKALFNRFVREDAGQDLIEYGLLVGLITAGTVTFIQGIGPIVQGWFSNLCANIGC